jgi:hypothetical protein
MKRAIAALLDRIRGVGSGDEGDIVRQACLDPAGQAPATKAFPIALSYYIGVRNVGDLVSPIAVQDATGRSTLWKPRSIEPHLLGAGGILHWANEASHVWGAGIANLTRGFGDVRAERVWALRGKLTHTCLAHDISGLGDVPLGDPGYLVGRRLAALMPPTAPAGRLGIVPHFLDRDHPAIAHLRGQEGVIVLDVRDSAPTFFAQMMACEAIASSALHGSIFAEALGIPNVWLDFGPEDPDRAFEFQDWFSLANRPQSAPLRIGAQPPAGDLIAAAALHEMTIDEGALRTAIPEEALEELSVSRGRAARIVHVLACRRRKLPIFLPCGDLGNRLHDLAVSYRKQSMPTELILVDGGAGGPETREAIVRLEQEGALVRVIDPGTSEEQTQSLRRVIQLYFKDWGEPGRFAITSSAVDFSIAAPEAFALYDELLDRFPDVEAVGPMLRIQDLARDHPVLNSEIAEHWVRERSWCETSLGRVSLVRSSLAGNFALCRADGSGLPPRSGIRVHHPFEARNLEWTDAATPTPLQARRLYW